MIKLSLNDIRNLADSKAFREGLKLHQKQLIQNISTFSQSIVGYVFDVKTYEVSIQIELVEKAPVEFHCDCDYDQTDTICPHITALLLEILYTKEKLDFSFNNTITNNLIDRFTNVLIYSEETIEKQSISIIPVIDISYSEHMLFSMKIGTTQFYIIKDIIKFIRIIHNNETMYFGKNYRYDPQLHQLDKPSLEILAIVEEFLKLAKNMTGFVDDYLVQSQVKLPIGYWIRLFNLLKNVILEVKDGSHYESQTGIANEIAMNFEVYEKNDIINITSPNKTSILLPSEGYVSVDQVIYQLDKDRFQYFKVIHEALVEHHNKITIEQSFKHNFASSILPVLKEMGVVNLGPQINKTLYTDTLVAEIFLDEYQNTIKGTITFNYGDYQLHILPRDTSQIPEHVTIIQDLKKEAEIINLLKSSYCVFDASNEYFTIIKEDYLYDFIYDALPLLQEIATVYYSDAFKQLHIKHPSGFQGGVSISSSGMLDFSFEIDGVSQEEIHKVVHALRNKQKYYRLKNGQFLPLEEENYVKMNQLLEELDLYDLAETKASIQLPLYRAFTLNHLMRETSHKAFHKSRVFKQLLEDIKEPGDIEIHIPTSLKATLRPYQETGFKWLKALNQYGFGGILADDMGLGKTIQAITLIIDSKREKPSIVIAPTSLIYNWGSEIKRFAPHLKFLIVTGGKEKREQHIQNQINDYDIIITSYGAAKRDILLYEDTEFEYCIIDEAQHIKNHLSQNALAVKLMKARTKLALTGTPIENNISELWSIFDFIMPGYLGNHKYFVKRYEKPITKENNPKALQQLIEQISPFILRRLKKDVLLELPPKIETTMFTDLSNNQKAMYLAVLEQTRSALSVSIKEDGYGKNTMKIFAALTKLRQVCCHPALIDDTYEGGSNKLALLEELILDAIESGHRLLIFSSFTGMLKMIRALMTQHNIGYFYLDGQTKAENRLEMTKLFNKGENDVFLISLKAGGTGLNLTGADMVIHYDPWWNPAAEEQATDRAYRIGQNKSVQVIKLLTTGTIEEKIFALQEQKKSLIDSVITPGETFINHLSEEELIKLFSLDSPE